MPTLSLHIKSQPSGLIKEPYILLSYSNSDNRVLVEKMLKHRKVEYIDLATRACSQEEFEEQSHPHRIELIKYQDWDQLIRDEHDFTQDKEWFKSLSQLKEKFKQFNINQNI